jgi:hypothetical protein
LYNYYSAFFFFFFYCRALDLPSRAIRFSHSKLQNYTKKISIPPFRSKVHGQTDRQNHEKQRTLSLFLSFTGRRLKMAETNSLSSQPLGGNRSSHLLRLGGFPFQPPSVLLLKWRATFIFLYGRPLELFLFSPFFFSILLSLMIFTRRWTREQQQLQYAAKKQTA